MADQHQRNYDEYRRGGHNRDWTERAGDEVRSWFGDDEARVRRMQDEREERYQQGGEGRRYEGGRPGDWPGRYDERDSRGGWSSESRGWREPGYGREPGAGGGYYGQSWRGGEWSGGGRSSADDWGRSRWQSTSDEPRWGQDPSSWRQERGAGERGMGGRGGVRESGFSGGHGGYGGYAGSGGGYAGGGFGGRSHGGWSGQGWSGEYGSEGARYRDDEYGGSWARRSDGGDGHRSAGFSGRGPKDYQRSDDRIREEISDRMTDDDRLDASDISVQVSKGEVTLTGTVGSRDQKRRAEDLAESISGVREVTNNIRVAREDSERHSTSATQAGQLGQSSGKPGSSKSAGTGTTS
jgi:hypothetical protein